MRFLPLGAGLALVLATVSSVSHGQRPEAPLDPRSVALLAEGRAQAATGQYDLAINTLETALAVDPRNREAYLVLARVATRQELPGKAIRLYREALERQPNDVAALSGQGEALVQKGALGKARENLTKINSLCASAACPESVRLAAAIARGPAVRSAQAVSPTAPVTADR